MDLDDETRGPLTYSAYINDRAIIEALRMPPRPAGVEPASWPTWRGPDRAGRDGDDGAGTGRSAPREGRDDSPAQGDADAAPWAPGDEWPVGGPWSHDEVLFIRTHQAFEVWFALAIHELSSVVREAGEAFAGAGSAVPRVHLARSVESPIPFDREAFPELAAAVEESIARHGADRRGAFDVIGNPGRTCMEVSAAPDLGAGDGLDRWATRVQRAGAALLATLPFWDVLSTLTPGQFLLFRDRLQPASGFGSTQFREIELLLGLREANESRLRPAGGAPHPDLPGGMLRPSEATPKGQVMASFHRSLPPWGWHAVAKRFEATSLRDVVYAILAGSAARDGRGTRPLVAGAEVDRFAAEGLRRAVEDWHRGVGTAPFRPGDREAFARALADWDAHMARRETIAAAVVEMSAPRSPLGGFLTACLGLDAALLRWRDAHIRFVEAMIGSRRGTGGGGIAYLRTTTDTARPDYVTHAFPALWHARSFVQRAE